MSNLNYFKTQGKKLIFTGNKLEAYVPLRFEIHNCLFVGETVKTIGFFDMVINSTIPSGLRVSALVEMAPTSVETTTIDGDSFLKLTFQPGDVFLVTTDYVRSKRLSYVLFYEMTYGGHYPKFVDNTLSGMIYNYVNRDTGLKVDLNQAMYELMDAHLSRSKDDVNILWRLTDMTQPPNRVGLHRQAQLTTSVTSKLSGSYLKQGLESALSMDPKNLQRSDSEDLLRS